MVALIQYHLLMKLAIKDLSQKVDQQPLQVLKKIKHNLKALVVDYDGTIFDAENPQFNHQQAADLLISVMNKGIVPVVISARDVSFFLSVAPLLESSLSKEKKHYYFAGGNGSYLLKISKNSKELIYNYCLTQDEIDTVLTIYEGLIKKLNLTNDNFINKGIVTFSDFLTQLATKHNLMEPKLLNLAHQYGGAIFIEKSKISFVLPRDEKLKQLFQTYLIKSIPKDLTAKGDSSYIHVTKKIKLDSGYIDGKLLALKTVMQLLNLSAQELVVFGDSPMGNDQAMLNHIPYSFTNNQEFIPLENSSLSYLSGTSLPVEKVHQAIMFLIANQ